MGLELTRISAGSGKNGKIVAEDVRSFKSKMEQANGVVSQEAPLFSAANA
jgi:pyruvate/2-oxoglutarate dehydrogenase complex dihydrolipoamide acyltransferase (E2) component